MADRILARSGSLEFNHKLRAEVDELALRIGTIVPGCLAVILGGGYGRGEGGVVRRRSVGATGSGERKEANEPVEAPYNDLDIFVVVADDAPQPDATQTARLEEARQAASRRLEIAVDIGRPLTPRRVTQLPQALMWYDLIHGHYTAWGDEGLLSRVGGHLFSQPIPAIEGTRLLLNRGVGLILAAYRLRGLNIPVAERVDDDFVRRNVFKALLAAGDALLIVEGRYAPTADERAEAVGRIAGLESTLRDRVVAAYRRSATFKESPSSFAAEGFDSDEVARAADLWTAAFLAVESQRTGVSRDGWGSTEDYQRARFLREPALHTPKNRVLNLLRNARLGRVSFRYPRELLYRTLPSRIERAGALQPSKDPKLRRLLHIWERYN